MKMINSIIFIGKITQTLFVIGLKTVMNLFMIILRSNSRIITKIRRVMTKQEIIRKLTEARDLQDDYAKPAKDRQKWAAFNRHAGISEGISLALSYLVALKEEN
jgi:hypothetical protein